MFLVGQAMQKLKGKAKAEEVKEKISNLLTKTSTTTS